MTNPSDEGHGRRCVVTGISRGIGAATASYLAETGYDVIGVGRTCPDEWRHEFIEADLQSPDGIAGAEAGIAKLGTLWALINNAAASVADPIDAISLADLERVFRINAFAPALLTKAAVTAMPGGGRIVNICSTAMSGRPERTAYGASKSALATMTRGWAAEFAPRRITVNAVTPGPIETKLFRSRNPIGSDREASVLARVPLGVLGQPAEVARLVAFLIHQKSSFITGQLVAIDGGISLGQS